MRSRFAVSLLLCIQALLMGWIGWVSCPNRTEVGHMAATVYLWHTLHFDVFHVNPPLTRVISGLPVVLSRPNYDWNFYSSRPRDRSEWAMGTAFIAANSSETNRWCFAVARWSLAPIFLVGGYFGHRLSYEIYGAWASWIFLILWCFSPLLLAWGGTICPDGVAAALGIVALYVLRRWLHQPSWIRTIVAGLCLGLLPLAKLTWIIAFAIWPVIWCCWAAQIHLARVKVPTLLPPPLRQLTSILLIGLYTVNMGYLFDGTCRPLGEYVFISEFFRGQEVPENQQMRSTQNRFAGTWLGVIPVPFPAEFVRGIDTQRYDFEGGQPSYLSGERADHGWWYYYLYALAVKEPLGTWCLVLLAILVTMCHRDYNAALRDEILVLAPLLTILIAVSSQTGFSAHPRYIIPALPFLFVWISKLGHGFTLRHRAVANLTVASLACMVTSSLWIYPHSLSYFNELAGGPKNGPKHLLGSNVDWGQDLFYLEDWCLKHPDARPIQVAYDGMFPLEKTKIPSNGQPPISSDAFASQDENGIEWRPQPGWYALSVNEIYSPSKQYRYFIQFEPVAMAGYSIYIYHITTGFDVPKSNAHRKADSASGLLLEF